MKMPNSFEATQLIIQRCIQTLEHSCKCNEPKCRLGLYSCQRMKRLFAHARVRKRKRTASDNCGICCRLILLCYYHAKPCREKNCKVPFCTQIKKKTEERFTRNL